MKSEGSQELLSGQAISDAEISQSNSFGRTESPERSSPLEGEAHGDVATDYSEESDINIAKQGFKKFEELYKKGNFTKSSCKQP